MSWYKQDRDVFSRVWAKDEKMMAVYLYLHCCAYVQDGMLHGQLIRRGSCPITRMAIVEATGLTECEVKLRLRKLKDYGEIIVNTSNKGMIITLCDYDGYNEPEDLFALNQSDKSTLRTTPQTPVQSTPQTTPYIDIKNIDNKNIRSHYIPSNNEREKGKGLAYEIKALYNKTFEGQLPEWKRLSDKMADKVGICIGRYGRQSVDMVFDQVLHEKFSMGRNDTGFIADFDFIFRLDEYEKYLSRYELRKRKGVVVSRAGGDGDKEADGTAATTNYSSPTERRRSFLLGWIDSEHRNPTKRGQELLKACQDSGELQQLGIDWKPNKQQIV